MPPTTVLTYQKQNHYDDILSISTNEIQKVHPTSLCDDIANQFYIHCLHPLVQLVPPDITTEDRQRRLIERALELGRGAVIDGSDVNVMRRNTRFKDNRNTRPSSHCQMEGHRQSSLEGVENRLTSTDEESHNSDDSDSFVITDKPKKRDEAYSSTRFISVAKKPPRMTVPTAIKKMSLHTVEQCTKIKLMDIKTKGTKQTLVNEKGFNIKPKMFRRSRTESNEIIHDDMTSSSSNSSESSCYNNELVVTEVTAREFYASRETKEKNDSEDELPSSQHVDDIPTLHCNEDTTLSQDTCIDQSQFQDSKPIVASARETAHSVGDVKRCMSSPFVIEESPRRTVYSEDVVDRHVAKLIFNKNSSPVKALMQSNSEKYSQDKQVKENQPTSGQDDGKDSTNMCELKNYTLSPLDSSSKGKQSNAATRELCTAVPLKAVETPLLLPSVISFRKTHKYLDTYPLSPVSFSEPSRNESKVTQPLEDVASNISGAVRQEHENDDFGDFRSSALLKRYHAPADDDMPAISRDSHYTFQSNKLDRLRMVRSARFSEKSQRDNTRTDQYRKVTWAETLPKYRNATETHYRGASRSRDKYRALLYNNAQILKSTSALEDASDEMGTITSHADSNRLKRLRMARSIPYQQQLIESGQPFIVSTAFNQGDEAEEPKPSSYPVDNYTKCLLCEEQESYRNKDASSVRNEMNRRAQYLHQKRYTSCASQRENAMAAQQGTLEIFSPITGSLLGSARRIRSFQKKIDMRE